MTATVPDETASRSSNPFSFRGRASRKTFWLTLVALYALLFALQLGAIGLHFAGDPSDAVIWIALVGMVAVGLATWAVLLAIMTRRLHDLDMSALWLSTLVLIALPQLVRGLSMPIELHGFLLVTSVVLTIALFIVLGFVPGTRGRNVYGPDPASA